MAITRWEPFRGVTRWDPWRELNHIREVMNQAFGEVPVARGEEGMLAPAWMPPVDVYETPEAIVLKAELPGIQKEDVDIQVERNVLTLKGERKAEREVKEENYYRLERQTGTFYRSFSLPHSVQADRIEASMRDGVLEVRLPKAEEAKPKKVKVS